MLAGQPACQVCGGPGRVEGGEGAALSCARLPPQNTAAVAFPLGRRPTAPAVIESLIAYAAVLRRSIRDAQDAQDLVEASTPHEA